MCCEGSGLKLAIGTMIASAVFSFSALLVEFSAMALWKYKPMFRALFALVLYVIVLVPTGTGQRTYTGDVETAVTFESYANGFVLTLVLGTTDDNWYLTEEIRQNDFLMEFRNGQERQYMVLLLLALLENTAAIRNLHYCGDATVNAVLTVKAAAMEETKAVCKKGCLHSL